jgi:type VI secretion system protein ImpI
VSRGYVLHCDFKRREFSALPIRIGRNALNDFPLPFQIVSAFHCRIEEAEGALGVVDLNSRNGTFVRAPDGRLLRVPPGQNVDLGPYGNEFLLGPNVVVKVELVEQQAAERVFSGSVLGNQQMLLAADRPSYRAPSGSAPPGGLPTGAMPQGGLPTAAVPQAPMPTGAIPRAPMPTGAMPQGGLPSFRPVHALPSLDGSRPLQSNWAQEPERGRGPSAPPPQQPYSQAGGRATHDFNIGLAELALTGLRELAASLTPRLTIETTGDVARMVTRLHDAMEVFCRCFIPMREGHTQFVSSFDLQREATQRGRHRSAGYAKVEAARTPEEVAAALLDFRDPSQDSAAAIEGIFADLMVHQVALLDGVMQGVRALLDEMSPAAIEQAVESNSTALALTLGRYRALWQEYLARHEELSDEKQALQRIFGSEFAVAYHNYGKRRDQ